MSFLIGTGIIKHDTLQSKYNQILKDCMKAQKITLLEYEYLIKFISDNILVNSSWLIEIIDRLNDKNLCDIICGSCQNLFDNISNKIIHKNLSLDLVNDRKNYIDFNKEQKKTLLNLLSFLSNHQEPFYGVYGYAGTGKTTILVELVIYLLKNKLIKSVALTAPTNKAVNVIKSKFKNYIIELYEVISKKKLDMARNFDFDDILHKLVDLGIKINFITIHKLLSFQMDFNDEGDTILIFKNSKKSLLDNYNMVLIDECSMISVSMIEHIFNEIRRIKTSNNYQNLPKIIFSGDPAKLPPVHESSSVIFTYSNIPNITLKKVMRTKLESVMNICYQMRLWALDIDFKLPELKSYICDGVYAYQNNSSKIKTKWFKKCLEYFSNTEKNECNIILTWTNRQSDEYNMKIRTLLFGENIDKYVVGDILILNDFYVNLDYTQSTVKLYTSEQIKIVNIQQINKKIDKFSNNISKLNTNKYFESQYKQFINFANKIINTDYECYKLYVKLFNHDHDDNKNTILYVIKDSNLLKWTNDKDLISSNIKKLKNMIVKKFPDKNTLIEEQIIKPLWRQFHKNIISPFANVNYGYSITCHKGQGSSFYNVFVDTVDIMSNIKTLEMRKCLYTALSRTTNELHILV